MDEFWPTFEDVDIAYKLKERMRVAVRQQRGWRTNAQLQDDYVNPSRSGRNERAIANKALYRIFTKRDDWDQSFPFEQYVPHGLQNVPPIRGWRLTASPAAKVYFQLYREVKVLGNRRHENTIMNDILEDFVNPFVCYPSKDCSLAEKVLRQAALRREQEILWPTPADRLAKKFIDKWPHHMSWKEWVAFWSQQGN